AQAGRLSPLGNRPHPPKPGDHRRRERRVRRRQGAAACQLRLAQDRNAWGAERTPDDPGPGQVLARWATPPGTTLLTRTHLTARFRAPAYLRIYPVQAGVNQCKQNDVRHGFAPNTPPSTLACPPTSGGPSASCWTA